VATFLLLSSIIFPHKVAVLLGNKEGIFSLPIFTLKKLRPHVDFALLLNKAKTSRGVYLNGWSLSSEKKRSAIEMLLEQKLINALVIDVKDSETFLTMGTAAHIQTLKAKYPDIWLAARIAVFRDTQYAKANQNVAIASRKGGLFTDSLGQHWIDPSARAFWDYIVEVSKTAMEMGFDELNFDYIRFPSLSDYSNLVYPNYTTSTPKTKVLAEFFRYLNSELKKYKPDIVLSADIFGQTLLQDEEENTGQRLQDLTRYFDVVAPMVYPSHYAAENFGYKNPATHPYEIVYGTLEQGIKLISNITTSSITTSSSSLTGTPSTDLAIRPWYQAFDLGAIYTPEMVKKQIAAGNALGIRGFILWNPSSMYSREVFE